MSGGVAESLRTYGTVQFSLERMSSQIRIGRDDGYWRPGAAVGGGAIDGTMWWAFVPEIYRSQVQPIVDAVSRSFIGRKLTAELLGEFVRALHRRIWSEVEPR